MIYGRTIFGKWSKSHVYLLSKHGITITEGYDMFGIEEKDLYFKIIEQLKDAPEFSDRRSTAWFNALEIEASSTYVLQGPGLGPALAYPARLSDRTDVEDGGQWDYLRYAFGDICPKYGTPISEQQRPLTLDKEPKLPKKYLWGGFHGISGYLFTDWDRYRLLQNTWGLGKREVLIGKKQKISPNFVQVEIPISKSPLYFGDSEFGKTLRLDGSGAVSETKVLCPACGRPLYTNQTLDFFPDFEQEAYEFDLVFTQEWFGWYRRLVVSKKFAQWFVDHKFGKWDSNYFIPVKSFKP